MKHTYCDLQAQADERDELENNIEVSKSPAMAVYAIDHFLSEMQQLLNAKIDDTHRLMSLGAYTSADKAAAHAECLNFVISRYKQNKRAGLC